MTRAFHPAAWLAWTAAAVVVVQGLEHPLLLGVALAAITFVAVTMAADGGPYGLMLKIGLVALGIRVVLFGLTGHPAGTTVASLPTLKLPSLLGGFALGGDVSAEVLVASAVEGARLAAVLVCFGTFLSVVEVARMIRLVPRFLFEAGLVVAIGVSFVPTLVRTARDVREAQRMRGHRARGIRAVAPVAMPILATTLERAVTVAESMEARGYGRARSDASAREARARAAVLASATVTVLGAVAAAFRWGGPASWALPVAGAVPLAVSLRALSRLSARTTYRRDRPTGWDRALLAGSVALAAAALLARRLDPAAFAYSPYPAVSQPETEVWGVLLVAGLAIPPAIAAARTVWLRRKEAPA